MFTDPKQTLETFGLKPGATVVDLGCGTGHYALAAAPLVAQNGEQGVVYAVDVQKDLLDRLKVEAGHQHITNIHVVWGDIEKVNGTKLPAHVADVVIISNVLFQVEPTQQPVLVSEVARIIKSGGRVLFIDWLHAPGTGFKPMPGHHGAKTLSKAAAQELFTTAGFTADGDISVGSGHYGILFRKK